MTLSAYEKKEWDRLQERKAASLRKQSKQFLPEKARARMSKAAETAKSAPGASQVSAAYGATVSGLGHAATSTASRTVSPKSVFKQFEKAGYPLESLADIRGLDLQEIDQITHLNRVRYGHSMAAAVAGAGSGALVTGGSILAGAGTVAGAGAGAAPGLGTITASMASDAAAVLTLASRTVAATALHYGYDPQGPEEEIFMMSVIGLGMAAGTSAKSAAYAELSQLTQLLVRNATWAQLNDKMFTKIVQTFVTKFGSRLPRRKLGQFVPVAGIAVGAGMNFAIIDRVSTAAHFAYRERFLVEKADGDLTSDAASVAPMASDNSLGVLQILETEGVFDGAGDLSEVADGDTQAATPQ